MIVVLLFLWISGCDAPLPDSTDAVEARSQSVSSSLKPAFLDTKPDLILTGPTESYTQYGNYPRFGDVNGDGYDDLLVAGASRYNKCQGRLYLYYGGKDMDDRPDKIFTGEKAGDFFGEEAYLADVNGDGYADVVTGAFGYNNMRGRVYIYFGGPGMDEDADLIIKGEAGTHGGFGSTITAGDINNDDCDDVLVSAIWLNGKRGRAYLFYGGNPMDTTADLVFDGENEDYYFGRDINNPKMIGDVNGDGYGDLLISSRYWNYWAGASGQGRAFLYYGGPGTSMDSIPDKVFTGENRRDDFGVSGCIFDIDNDGFDDVIIGVRSYNNRRGRAYLYWGGEDMDTIADKTFDGEAGTQDSFGCGMDAGYVNYDDYGDFIVTAPYSNTGKAFLFYGDTKASINTACDKTFTLPTGTNFPQHVALGDLSNDNYPDVSMGGYRYNNGQGRVWLYYNKPPGSTDEQPISLQEAAASGEIDKVEALISKGVDVNVREWGSLKTALHYAVEKRHEKVVELLLVKGADTDARDAFSATPLHYAVERGYKEMVELLIVNGAEVNAKDKWGYTPLYYAIWNEDKDMIRLLVAKGADVSFTPKDDYPSLHYAVWNEDMELAELLVNNGAKFDVKDKDGWTAFRYATAQGSRDIVEFFVSKGADASTFQLAACMGDLERVKSFVKQGTDIDEKDELNWTPLYWAASNGQENVAEFLIANGADINAKINDNSTPLHQAAKTSKMKLVELFISKGANVNAENKYGNKPLHGAASAGHREVVDLLIAKGANVNAKGRRDWTPLHGAARAGHRDVVEMLIAKGADVNAKNDTGWTALHLAARYGKKDVAELLIAKGADVNVTDKDGRTPLSCAQRHEEIFELLRKHDAEEWGNTPLHWAARQDDPGLVLIHIAQGADVNTKDEAGRTVLHLAATYGKKDVVELLIAKGADVNAKDNQSRTPLWHAQDKGHTEIIELLRNHDAKE